MPRSPRTALLSVLLACACNAVFGLEKTHEVGIGAAGAAGVAGEGGTAGGAGEGGAAGDGPSDAGAAGEAGATGGEAGEGAGEQGASGQGGAAQGGGKACPVPGGFDKSVKCSGDNACSGEKRDCGSNSNSCEFVCLGKQSCANATFTCPTNGLCRVICSGEGACEGTTIECGKGACDVVCLDPPSTCAVPTSNCPTEKPCPVICPSDPPARTRW